MALTEHHDVIKFGDTILLHDFIQDGFLTAARQKICQIMVETNDFSTSAVGAPSIEENMYPRPVDPAGCCFRVTPKLAYSKFNKFKKTVRGLNDEDLSSPEFHASMTPPQRSAYEAMQEERQDNFRLVGKMRGSPVIYGAVIQLYHKRTGAYVTMLKEKADVDHAKLKVSLDEEGNKNSWFNFKPGFKTGKMGESVPYPSVCTLTSTKNDVNLFVSNTETGLENSHMYVKDVLEVNAFISSTVFRVFPYQLNRDPNAHDLQISSGTPFTLLHSECDAFLVCEAGRCFYKKKNSDKDRSLDSSALWTLEGVSAMYGGEHLDSHKFYRLQHVISGLVFNGGQTHGDGVSTSQDYLTPAGAWRVKPFGEARSQIYVGGQIQLVSSWGNYICAAPEANRGKYELLVNSTSSDRDALRILRPDPSALQILNKAKEWKRRVIECRQQMITTFVSCKNHNKAIQNELPILWQLYTVMTLQCTLGPGLDPLIKMGHPNTAWQDVFGEQEMLEITISVVLTVFDRLGCPMEDVDNGKVGAGAVKCFMLMFRFMRMMVAKNAVNQAKLAGLLDVGNVGYAMRRCPEGCTIDHDHVQPHMKGHVDPMQRYLLERYDDDGNGEIDLNEVQNINNGMDIEEGVLEMVDGNVTHNSMLTQLPGLDFLIRFVPFKFQAVDTLAELFHGNRKVLSALSDAMLDELIIILREKHEKSSAAARFVDLLGNICVCDGVPISENQERVLERFVMDPRLELRLQYRKVKGKGVVPHIGDVAHGGDWIPLTNFAGKTAQILAKGINDCTLEEKIYRYHLRSMGLFVALCNGRNRASTDYLLSRAGDYGLAYSDLMKVLKNDVIPPFYRGIVAEVIVALYIDREPNEIILPVQRIHIWSNIKPSHELQRQKIDPFKKFPELRPPPGFQDFKDYLLDFLRSSPKLDMGNVNKATLQGRMILMAKLLLEFGFYHNPDMTADLQQCSTLIDPLLELLDGRADGPERFQASQETVPIFDAKFNICKILEFVFDCRQDKRLRITFGAYEEVMNTALKAGKYKGEGSVGPWSRSMLDELDTKLFKTPLISKKVAMSADIHKPPTFVLVLLDCMNYESPSLAVKATALLNRHFGQRAAMVKTMQRLQIVVYPEVAQLVGEGRIQVSEMRRNRKWLKSKEEEPRAAAFATVHKVLDRWSSMMTLHANIQIGENMVNIGTGEVMKFQAMLMNLGAVAKVMDILMIPANNSSDEMYETYFKIYDFLSLFCQNNASNQEVIWNEKEHFFVHMNNELLANPAGRLMATAVKDNKMLLENLDEMLLIKVMKFLGERKVASWLDFLTSMSKLKGHRHVRNAAQVMKRIGANPSWASDMYSGPKGAERLLGLLAACCKEGVDDSDFAALEWHLALMRVYSTCCMDKAPDNEVNAQNNVDWGSLILKMMALEHPPRGALDHDVWRALTLDVKSVYMDFALNVFISSETEVAQLLFNEAAQGTCVWPSTVEIGCQHDTLQNALAAQPNKPRHGVDEKGQFLWWGEGITWIANADVYIQRWIRARATIKLVQANISDNRSKNPRTIIHECISSLNKLLQYTRQIDGNRRRRPRQDKTQKASKRPQAKATAGKKRNKAKQSSKEDDAEAMLKRFGHYKRLFQRFDLEGVGTIDTYEVLEQYLTALAYHLPLDPEQLKGVMRAAKAEMNDGMNFSLEEFTEWFEAQLSEAGQCDGRSSEDAQGRSPPSDILQMLDDALPVDMEQARSHANYVLVYVVPVLNALYSAHFHSEGASHLQMAATGTIMKLLGHIMSSSLVAGPLKPKLEALVMLLEQKGFQYTGAVFGNEQKKALTDNDHFKNGFSHLLKDMAPKLGIADLKRVLGVGVKNLARMMCLDIVPETSPPQTYREVMYRIFKVLLDRPADLNNDIVRDMLRVMRAAAYMDDPLDTAGSRQDASWEDYVVDQPPMKSNPHRKVLGWVQDKISTLGGIIVAGEYISHADPTVSAAALRFGITLMEHGNRTAQATLLKHLVESQNHNFFCAFSDFFARACTAIKEWRTHINQKVLADRLSTKRSGVTPGGSMVPASGGADLVQQNCAAVLKDASLALRFLQLCMEGHYHAFQDLVREQVSNQMSFNLLNSALGLLASLEASLQFSLNNKHGTILPLLVQLCEFLTETMQGSCFANQQDLSSTQAAMLYDKVLKGTAFSSDPFYDNEMIEGPTGVLVTIRSAKCMVRYAMVKTVVSILEDNYDSKVGERILSSIDCNACASLVISVYDGFEDEDGEPLAEEGEDGTVIGQMLEMAELKHSDSEITADDVHDHAIQTYCLMKYLQDRENPENGPVNAAIRKIVGRPELGQAASTHPKSAAECLKWCSTIEVARHHWLKAADAEPTTMMRVHFQKPTFLHQIQTRKVFKNHCEQKMEDIPRENPVEKTICLLKQLNGLADEMGHMHSLMNNEHEFSPYLARITSGKFLTSDIVEWSDWVDEQPWKWAVMIVAVMTFTFGPRNEAYVKTTFVAQLVVQIMVILQFFFAVWWCCTYYLVEAPIRVKFAAKIQTTAGGGRKKNPVDDLLPVYAKELPPVPVPPKIKTYKEWLAEQKSYAWNMKYRIFMMSLSFCAMLGGPEAQFLIFFWVVDYFRLPYGAIVMAAIANAGRNLLLILCGMFQLCILWIGVGFWLFQEDFNDYSRKSSGGTGNGQCESLTQCLMYSFGKGIRGSLDSVWGPLAYEHTNDFPMYIWDEPMLSVQWALTTLWFVVWRFTFIGILTATIVMVFSGLRTKENMLIKDKNEKCMVCSLDRFTIEQDAEGFIAHTQSVHSPWSYLAFLAKLRLENPDDFTGLESDVKTKADVIDQTFLPVKLCTEIQALQRRRAKEKEQLASMEKGKSNSSVDFQKTVSEGIEDIKAATGGSKDSELRLSGLERSVEQMALMMEAICVKLGTDIPPKPPSRSGTPQSPALRPSSK